MANELNIRPLLAEHLAELQMLEQACFAGAWSEQQLERQLSHARAVNLGLWQGPQLVGFALLSTLLDEAELLQIGVAPQQRGQGLARVLLEAAHCVLAEKAVSRVLLEVRESNTPARRLYHTLNYAQVGERPNYYPPLSAQSTREAAYLFTLNLADD